MERHGLYTTALWCTTTSDTSELPSATAAEPAVYTIECTKFSFPLKNRIAILHCKLTVLDTGIFYLNVNFFKGGRQRGNRIL